jgi:hypothetical protein
MIKKIKKGTGYFSKNGNKLHFLLHLKEGGLSVLLDSSDRKVACPPFFNFNFDYKYIIMKKI